MELVFIDHYDSFSFNVLEWLRLAADSDLTIHRVTCDDLESIKELRNNLRPLVISPGPGKPQDYPATLSLINDAISKVPILGICLGHQMIGEMAGGTIKTAIEPWHGTVHTIQTLKENWFTAGLKTQFKAVAYNSLVIDMNDAPAARWLVLAEDSYGQAMVLSHADLKVASVQFHPESFASDDLSILAKNFIAQISENKGLN
jgi:anthranilate synthase/aminodeoxychorismate synthase-like glutamine amidotransferase